MAGVRGRGPGGFLYGRGDEQPHEPGPAACVSGLSVPVHFPGNNWCRVVAEKAEARDRLGGDIGSGAGAETFAAYPNFIPFFNVVASNLPGGKLELLSDSNIDWGQDLPLVKKWQEQHPDRIVYLIFSGSADPSYYGIKYFKGKQGTQAPSSKDTAGKKVVMAISAIELQETNTSDLDRGFYAPFRQSQPLDVSAVRFTCTMFTDLQLDQTLQNLKPKGATLSRRGAVVITAIVAHAADHLWRHGSHGAG